MPSLPPKRSAMKTKSALKPQPPATEAKEEEKVEEEPPPEEPKPKEEKPTEIRYDFQNYNSGPQSNLGGLTGDQLFQLLTQQQRLQERMYMQEMFFRMTNPPPQNNVDQPPEDDESNHGDDPPDQPRGEGQTRGDGSESMSVSHDTDCTTCEEIFEEEQAAEEDLMFLQAQADDIVEYDRMKIRQNSDVLEGAIRFLTKSNGADDTDESRQYSGWALATQVPTYILDTCRLQVEGDWIGLARAIGLEDEHGRHFHEAFNKAHHEYSEYGRHKHSFRDRCKVFFIKWDRDGHSPPPEIIDLMQRDKKDDVASDEELNGDDFDPYGGYARRPRTKESTRDRRRRDQDRRRRTDRDRRLRSRRSSVSSLERHDSDDESQPDMYDLRARDEAQDGDAYLFPGADLSLLPHQKRRESYSSRGSRKSQRSHRSTGSNRRRRRRASTASHRQANSQQEEHIDVNGLQNGQQGASSALLAQSHASQPQQQQQQQQQFYAPYAQQMFNPIHQPGASFENIPMYHQSSFNQYSQFAPNQIMNGPVPMAQANAYPPLIPAATNGMYGLGTYNQLSMDIPGQPLNQQNGQPYFNDWNQYNQAGDPMFQTFQSDMPAPPPHLSDHLDEHTSTVDTDSSAEFQNFDPPAPTGAALGLSTILPPPRKPSTNDLISSQKQDSYGSAKPTIHRRQASSNSTKSTRSSGSDMKKPVKVVMNNFQLDDSRERRLRQGKTSKKQKKDEPPPAPRHGPSQPSHHDREQTQSIGRLEQLASKRAEKRSVADL